jgi:hypothetical protein
LALPGIVAAHKLVHVGADDRMGKTGEVIAKFAERPLADARGSLIAERLPVNFAITSGVLPYTADQALRRT